ncbi:AbrB/MazE/SpoVT family DNA-binding domain-containing protein [Mitsuaria sp. GD03876]|uniref:AbrB/MazE/SpoVT family DNA-binding domain-containing protein n=1 Tax=Mitsuaria sp. GD03876 TaxID=2975399 RepID=UPI002446AB65|nr:AbrB/MazE/SpoVT family DNA-binding domain-containing protein [Mitsuaria sp. GD03876]MDH0863769.1 AbrB/MazE/SpoVT family DNA-binding domain-containing protein [Mitsuaria sp. GD03876]
MDPHDLVKTGTYSEGQQLSVPDEVREILRLKPGDRVEFLQLSPQEFLIYSGEHPLSLYGMLGKPRRKVSLKDMNRAIRSRGGHVR